MNYKFFKNKKADITITLLVIGVFIVCALTLISFYSSDITVKKSFESVALVQKVSSLHEDILFYESIGKNPEEIMEIFPEDSGASFVFEGRKNGDGYTIIGTFETNKVIGIPFEDSTGGLDNVGLSDRKRRAYVEYEFES